MFVRAHRATSTKTRIKTLEVFPALFSKTRTHRATSTKTRIKTKLPEHIFLLEDMLTEQLPLKQGLRHS